MVRPRIGLTVGDPTGIGPEVVSKAIRDPQVVEACEPVVYGPMTKAELERFTTGSSSADGGRAAYDAIRVATSDALAGKVDAIATAPVSKHGLALAGLPWRGHTELLAHLTGTADVAMMFHAPRLRVVLTTVHVALADVPRLLTRARVETTIALAHGGLPAFGFLCPRLALAGLNPHAGEAGVIGKEDERVLRPAVETMRGRGVDISGPLSADTVFRRAVDGDYDAVIACYHDQGLIPVKLTGFGQAVNVTLGLPIIRTSVDHGTAYDIVGKDIADASSMIAAVLLAVRLANGRRVDHEQR